MSPEIRSLLPTQIVDALQRAIGPGPANLHEPVFNHNEWHYLKDCLDSTYVSSVGKYVDKFESGLVEFTGAKFVVAVVNGTAALHTALLLAAVETSDEVLMPALTFVATANAVAYCNAHPHFVDSGIDTLGVHPGRLREYLSTKAEMRNGICVNRQTGRKISALIAMHTFGHPADMEGLCKVCRDFNLILIEDAAESLGSFYHGRHTGVIGDIGILSFNGNKIITTGGGGAVLVNDPCLAKHAKHITTTAKIPHPWRYRHDQVGYNYRLPNINAALGCAQLETLGQRLDSKRALFNKYQLALDELDGVSLFEEPFGCKSNYWLQTIILENPELRNSVLEETNAAGYGTRPCWDLLNTLPHFMKNQTMNLEGAEFLAERIINLPSSSFLADG